MDAADKALGEQMPEGDGRKQEDSKSSDDRANLGGAGC